MPASSEHLSLSAAPVSGSQVGNYLGPFPWGWKLSGNSRWSGCEEAAGLASQLLPVLLPRGLI